MPLTPEDAEIVCRSLIEEAKRLAMQLDTFLERDGMQMVRAERAEDKLESAERRLASAQALIEMCEAALHKVEWGDADRPHQAYCPVCARSERGGHYREVCMALAAIEAHKKGEGA